MDSSALLNAVSDFKFVFGVSVLKVILSMTASLSSYLQKQTMNVVTARKTAEMTTKALQDCRNEESFNALWERAQTLSQTVKECIKDSPFSFKEAKQPRQRKPPKRLQALVGETGGDEQHHRTEKDHYQSIT